MGELCGHLEELHPGVFEDRPEQVYQLRIRQPSIGDLALPRLSLDHDQPPAAVRIRHRDTFDAVPAPLHDAPERPRSVGTERTGIARPQRGHGRLARGRPRSSTQVGRFIAPPYQRRPERRPPRESATFPRPRSVDRLPRKRRRRMSWRVAIGLRRSSRRSRSSHFLSTSRCSSRVHKRARVLARRTLASSARASRAKELTGPEPTRARPARQPRTFDTCDCEGAGE